MRRVLAVARKIWLPAAFALTAVLNALDGDIEGTFMFLGMAAIAVAAVVPDEYPKLEIAAYAVLAVTMLAFFVPRLYEAAERL